MLLSVSGEPTQIYLSNTHLRTPSSQNGQDGLTGGGGGGRMMAGTLKSNIGLDRGRQGTISVMTSLLVHHCPILKKIYIFKVKTWYKL